MIDTTQQTGTHELYTQFSQWLGVDCKMDSNYFMINYSLHAAEAYISKYYNITLTLNTVFEKINKNTVFSPSTFPTKLINVMTVDGEVYPTITYIDSNTGNLVTSHGNYTEDMVFTDTTDYYATYLTGYIYKDTTDYSTIDFDFDDEDRLPNPKIYSHTGQPVISPFNVYDSNE